MGSSLSGILASTYIARLESIALQSADCICYRRYVDDIFLITTNKEQAEKVLNTFNTTDPHIRFELEFPITSVTGGQTLNLLDLSITLTNSPNPVFNFYRKPIKADLFIHPDSALPLSCKINSINNEIHRINNRCTNHTDAEQHLEHFHTTLTSIGYPTHLINRILNSQKITLD